MLQKNEESKKREDRENAHHAESFSSSLDDKVHAVLESRAEQLRKELADKESQLQEDEKERIMAEHAAEIAKLQGTLLAQKDKQLNGLKSRMEDRKKLKETRRLEKQKAELQRIEEAEEEEKNKLENEETRKKEKAALSSVVHDMVDVGMDAKAQSLIHHLLNQRHLKERIVLDKQQKSNMKTALQKTRSDLLVEREKQRDELLARQEREIEAVMDEALTLSPELLAKKQEELKRQHNKELGKFDDDTESLLKKKEFEITAEKKVEFADQVLQLKEKQLLELSKTLRDMTGNEEQASKYAEQAEKIAADAEAHRDRIKRETAEKMELLKAEKLKREEEIKNKMAADLNAMEKELQEEEKRHQLREQETDKQHDLLAKRKMNEREKELQNELRDANEAEKDAILAKYNEDVKKITTMMSSEKDKSVNKLKEQLEARRNKRKAATLKKIEEKKNEEMEELNDQIRETKSAALIDGAKSLHGLAGNAYLSAPTKSNEATEEERNAAMQKIFENTDIFKQLSSIEEMLGLGGGKNLLKRSGEDKARPYIDLRDAQWSNSDTLRPMDVSKLSPSNFVIYRYFYLLSYILK